MSLEIHETFPVTVPAPRIDEKLHALSEAHRIWKLCLVANRVEKLEFARSLHALRAFSLTQLAKICRLSVATVARKMESNATGGRLTPECLTLLIQLRKLVTSQEQISRYLVEQLVYGGTSLSCAANLTGASYSALYKIHESIKEQTR
jgi:hypothetical protein